MPAAKLRPQTISRQLRREGFNISGSDRKYRFPGLFVSNSGHDAVSVMVDLELATKNARVAQQIEETLNDLGYQVQVRIAEGDDECRFITVTRENDEKER